MDRMLTVSDEQIVLSGMVNDKDYLELACSELKRDDFEKIEHQLLFDRVTSMYFQGIKVDIQSVYVHNREEIHRIGISWADIATVPIIGDTFNVAFKKLKENSAKRKLLQIMESINVRLKNGSMNVEAATSELENKLIESDRTIQRDYISPEGLEECCKQAVSARMDKEERMKNVVYTGYETLNANIGGFENGDLVIISGETGGGKSAFVNNLLKDIAIEQKESVLYMNSEMFTDQISLRWTSVLSGISHTALRNGEISEDEHQMIIDKLKVLPESKLHTITIPDAKMSSVLSEIKRAKRRHVIRIAVVDYIGRVDMENASQDDWKVMTGAARKLKTQAQSLGIVVIMVAQLNAQGRLAQASYMTHEADLWLNLRKPTEKEVSDNAWWNMFLEIKKARNAPQGTLKLFFDGERLTFHDEPIIDESFVPHIIESTPDSTASVEQED